MPDKSIKTIESTTLIDDISASLGLSTAPLSRIIIRVLVMIIVMVLYYLVRNITRQFIEKVVSSLLDKQSYRDARQLSRFHTLVSTASSAANLLTFFLLIIVLLSVMGVNVTAIIGTASVAGLAFGFGAQKLIKDVISGFFLVMEDQFAIGDYVTIGTVTGTVEDLALRITRLRDDDGRVHILSNGDIVSVCNASRGPLSAIVDIGISPEANVAEAIAVLEPILSEWAITNGLPDSIRTDGLAASDVTRVTLRLIVKTSIGQRPAVLIPRLRHLCRATLADASIKSA